MTIYWPLTNHIDNINFTPQLVIACLLYQYLQYTTVYSNFTIFLWLIDDDSNNN